MGITSWFWKSNNNNSSDNDKDATLSSSSELISDNSLDSATTTEAKEKPKMTAREYVEKIKAEMREKEARRQAGGQIDGGNSNDNSLESILESTSTTAGAITGGKRIAKYSQKEIDEMALENCAEEEYEMLKCQNSPKTWRDQLTACEEYKRKFTKCLFKEKEKLEAKNDI
ncbi:hypothetical protein H4219_005027 [Mycoemilia scoparia]|uniref:Uncharacterized protein n=1 Tax=Mycoemilia scoparia TaxID=417184 RepID=A0A9W7ZXR2_9FUNG|nr:hypothetical protein H4219_005027 [Mycoemilia scoparia]